MQHLSIASATALFLALMVPVSAHSPSETNMTGNAPTGLASRCSAPAAPERVEHRYSVAARIRPLLFWTARREVGEAWFAASETGGGRRRLELLIGTDPDRAPMRINRWGYIAETICDAGTDLIGLMTESDEQTITQAQAAAGEKQRVFKAIRAHASSEKVATEIISLSTSGDTTYHDLNGLLALLPKHAASREAVVPAGVDSGFLVAVTTLMSDGASAFRESARPPSGLRRAYIYGGRIYDMTVTASTVKNQNTTTLIESQFHVRNRATGSVSVFTITFLAATDDRDVPLRIVYRPRWWLEIELQLEAEG